MATLLKTQGDVGVNPKIKAVSVIQIDEFWHFTPKNGINFGLGWLYAPKEEKLLPFFVENGTKLRPRFGCTDGLASYQGVIPRRKHKISKKLTQTIESINATFHPYLARFHIEKQNVTENQKRWFLKRFCFLQTNRSYLNNPKTIQGRLQDEKISFYINKYF